MSASVEIVVGYDADGRRHEVILVDGHEFEPRCYELDPDARLLRRGRKGEWLRQQEQLATHASNQAAAWISRWAQQTAEHGNIILQDMTAYGVFVRPAGTTTTVLRMTPSGHVTDGELHAAVFPNEHAARRRLDQFRPLLDKSCPGGQVWVAPL